MTINTNIASMEGQIALKQTQAREATSLERLSTGLRINSAADDPSGLIAATELKSDLATLSGQQTGDDRLYLKASMADGVLGVVSDVLLAAKSLTVQNANTAGLDQKQLDANQIELDAIVTGIQRVGIATTFDAQPIFGPKVFLQSDASGAATGTANLDPAVLGAVYDAKTKQVYTLADLRSGGALADNANPEIADQVVETAIKQISGDRASLGSFTDALSVMGDVRGVTQENLTEALSDIEDTDFATEASEFVRDQTLSASGTAVLAVANSQPQQMLSLLSA